MSRYIKIVIVFCFLVSCEENVKVELDGRYWDSREHNLSYLIPPKFEHINIFDENELLSFADSNSNSRLSERIKNNQLRVSINAEALNFIFFSKQDSSNYTNIFISELPYVRISDNSLSYIEKYRDDGLYYIEKSSDEINVKLISTNFINTPEYQMVYSNIKLETQKDTLYYRQYITTKFRHTFIIEVESTSPFDYYPYLKQVKFKTH